MEDYYYYYEYDDFGRILNVYHEAPGDNTQPAIRYEYSQDGLKTTMTKGRIKTVYNHDPSYPDKVQTISYHLMPEEGDKTPGQAVGPETMLVSYAIRVSRQFLTKQGRLVVDVSANFQSVRLDLETFDPISGKSLSKSQLPAVPWGDKWSFSPDASTFARLGRNLASRPVIEVHDIASKKLLCRFEYAQPDTDGRPHVVGDVVLLDSNRLLTTHPKVIWD